MKKEGQAPRDIPSKTSTSRFFEKSNVKELSSFHKINTKTTLKTKKIQLSLNNLNPQESLQTSNTTRKVRAPAPLRLKPRGAQTRRDSRLTSDSRGSFSIEKTETLNRTHAASPGIIRIVIWSNRLV